MRSIVISTLMSLFFCTVIVAQPLWVTVGSPTSGIKNTTNQALILTSPDGKTWTQATNVPTWDITLYDVAYGNGKWFAVGVNQDTQTAAILESNDGISWNLSANIPAGTGSADNIAYGNGVWVVTGYIAYQSSIMSSTDNGNTWVDRHYPPNVILSDSTLTFGNNKFVMIGEVATSGLNFKDEIYTSTDGVNWQTAPQLPPGYLHLNSVAYGNGHWMAIGCYMSSTLKKKNNKLSYPDCIRPAILTSPDGNTWSAVPPPAGIGYEIEGLSFADGIWVARELSNTLDITNMLVSTDDTHWAIKPLPKGYSSPSTSLPGYAKGMWLLTTTNMSQFNYELNTLSSTDGGKTWTPQVVPNFGYFSPNGHVVYGGN